MKKFSNPDRSELLMGDPDQALSRVRFFAFCMTLVGVAFSISIASIGSVVYVAALAATLLRRPIELPRLPYLPLLAILAVSLGLSMILNGFPKESWQGVLKYGWGFTALYAGMEVMRGSGRWKKLAVLILVCEGVAVVSGVSQQFFGRDFINGRLPIPYTDQISRLTGPFKHCNDFATFLIPGTLLGCSLLIDRLTRRKWVPAVCSAILLAMIGWAMMRTMSRGAMMGVAAGLLVLAMMLPYRRWILAGVAVTGTLLWVIPSAVSVRLHQMIDLGSSFKERMYLAEGALKMIQSSPWFGLGLNTYSKWFPIFNPPPDIQRPVFMYAHNSYLQIATEAGWVGLGLYVAYIGACLLQSAFRIKSSDSAGVRWIRAAVLASAVGILVNALFESLLQSTQLRTLFWSMLGLAMAACPQVVTPTVNPKRK